MKEKFNVTGMTCSACSAHVEKAVSKLDGVEKVNVNLLSQNMTVDFDSKKVEAQRIINAVKAAGYGASSANSEEEKTSDGMNKKLYDDKNLKKRFIISLVFLVPLMYISMGHMAGLPLPFFLTSMENAVAFGFTQFLLTLPIMYVNRKYFEVGFKTLFKGSPNMDSLIAIGSSAAVLYGIFAIYMIGYGLGSGNHDIVSRYHMDLYFESAATILTLITLGKWLEAKSKGRTSEAIMKLMNLAPKSAVVVRNGIETEIPVEEIVVGDILVVKPGMSIPADGIVTEGQSSVDQSALTGESMPVEKIQGDKVMSATINKNGYFKFRAEKVGSNTTLSEIIKLVEEAGNSKAPIAKMADKISGIFVPVVISIAVISAIIWFILGKGFEFSLSIGISVLVISCPCALGLATPVAIMVGTGKGAEYGILVKSAEALETAHNIDTVVLDKTGTVTEGKPSVTDIITADGISETEFLKIAASLEKLSEHPLAEAVVSKCSDIELYNVGNFVAVSGRGISGEIDGKNYKAGNKAYLTENKVILGEYVNIADRLSAEGKTPLFFSCENDMLGVIAVSDTIKSTSKTAIEKLKKMNIGVYMLTGDNKKTAESIQKQLGIDSVIAEILPQDKEAEIRKLQSEGKKVAMVGDGINDAPALARADVGIAIGAGSDIAIDSADIILMKNELIDVVTTIHLSKSVIRNIKMNLFWAFFYNAVGIPLAAGLFYTVLGWKLNPMFAAAAMSLSSVCVVLNALRLKFFKADKVILKSNQNIKVEKEIKSMKKTILINGMSCSHCSANVEKALMSIEGVQSVEVDLDKKLALVTLNGEVSDKTLSNAVTDAGYEVVSVN